MPQYVPLAASERDIENNNGPPSSQAVDFTKADMMFYVVTVMTVVFTYFCLDLYSEVLKCRDPINGYCSRVFFSIFLLTRAVCYCALVYVHNVNVYLIKERGHNAKYWSNNSLLMAIFTVIVTVLLTDFESYEFTVLGAKICWIVLTLILQSSLNVSTLQLIGILSDYFDPLIYREVPKVVDGQLYHTAALKEVQDLTLVEFSKVKFIVQECDKKMFAVSSGLLANLLFTLSYPKLPSITFLMTTFVIQSTEIVHLVLLKGYLTKMVENNKLRYSFKSVIQGISASVMNIGLFANVLMILFKIFERDF